MFFSEPEIWFDDVDEILLDRKMKPEPTPVPEVNGETEENKTTDPSNTNVKNPLVKDDAFKG